MITLHYWPTPNGHKITLFLEETGMPYRIAPVDIGVGEQFKPDYLAIAPNGRMPAIVDDAPADGGAPLSLFESGAILLYLAEKTGQLLPADLRGRKTVLEWLFWQMAGFGPMLGQNHHFTRYAPEQIPYAIERYTRETARLYAVLDAHLAGRDFIAGAALSIADLACYPWAAAHDWHHVDLAVYPNVLRWYEAIKLRPATQRAYALGEQYRRKTEMTDEMKKVLFGAAAVPTKQDQR
ncbi:MAG TPA: glutathione S-transferase N-terminal domain-containing protein [Arenimonas sp.]|uniref:glutathione S-transferase N-terminal domain-containing protein n=1 Tax=Arenimonas sp. TaxID=1872635 RepID=UPI002C2DA375|nr:glutathione S-transferase N-terminal domain-containing protein [Arenimonas sp.]HMB56263.1 glutathione S-transferase N-terminal domain-containing protein [Arenimonas sp.]